MFAIIFFAVWLGLSFFQILVLKADCVETLLLNSLVINIGLGGMWSFAGHAFLADRVAASIGWPKGNPFQFEVAVANLALGVMGIVCVWLWGSFWIATIIACSIFLLGAAYGHTMEMIHKKNFSPGNAGPVFFTDIINPLTLIILAIIYFMK